MANIEKSLPNEVTNKIEIEGPEAATEESVELQESIPDVGNTEITPTEDGGVEINFEPGAFNQVRSGITTTIEYRPRVCAFFAEGQRTVVRELIARIHQARNL